MSLVLLQIVLDYSPLFFHFWIVLSTCQSCPFCFGFPF